MKAYEKARNAGFKSLKELSEITEESTQNLNNWHKKKPRRFQLLMKGAAAERLEDIK
jgi:hypothetical protein